MARLVYSTFASLDGYVADEDGRFDWATPDEEVHSFANGLESGVGTYLLGRRMYEMMLWWESPENTAGLPEYIREFAETWRAAEKIVYSSTLESVSSARTRIERSFDACAAALLKHEAARDLAIAGPTLAAPAIRAGIIDEYHLFVVPVVVGGGLSAFPRGVRMSLELAEQRRFGNGMLYLKYVPAAAVEPGDAG